MRSMAPSGNTILGSPCISPRACSALPCGVRSIVSRSVTTTVRVFPLPSRIETASGFFTEAKVRRMPSKFVLSFGKSAIAAISASEK